MSKSSDQESRAARTQRTAAALEAERRRKIGKFYHRPPGGESWSDVLLRLRAALTDLQLRTEGERVLLVAHQVVVLLVRYVLEDMDEQRVLAVDAQGDVANCSLTCFEYDAEAGRLILQAWNTTSPLADEGEIVTSEPDVAAGPC